VGRPRIPPIPINCEECGEVFYAARYKKQRFCSYVCSGTANRRLRKAGFNGKDNPRFNMGMCVHKGRAMVCCADGSVLWYSRALMAGKMKRLLRSDEIVHHVNGDGSDDRVENLMIVTRAEHLNIHRHELEAARGLR